MFDEPTVSKSGVWAYFGAPINSRLGTPDPFFSFTNQPYSRKETKGHVQSQHQPHVLGIKTFCRVLR